MPGQMYETATMANIQNVTRGQDNTLQVVVQGIERFRIAEWIQTTPYLRARIALATDIVESDVELEALQGTLRDLAQQVVALSPHVPRELRDFLRQVHDPRLLAYMGGGYRPAQSHRGTAHSGNGQRKRQISQPHHPSESRERNFRYTPQDSDRSP